MFLLLVPRTAWRLQQPELRPGSIVLVRYEVKFGKDRFQLGRVVDTRRDGDGLVRTAWVGLRSLRRAIREPSDVCRAGLTMMELPVQRLVLILPPEEQPAELLEGLDAFPPMPRGRQPRVPAQQDAPGPGLQALAPEEELEPALPQAPAVVVQAPDQAEEIRDLPRPQRAPRPRGRPRRAQ